MSVDDSLREDARALAPDLVELRRRLHRHPEIGLQTPVTQQAVLDTLDGPHSLSRAQLGPREILNPRERRAQNLQWCKEHAVPWIKRRLRGESSGDRLSAKRPQLEPVETL